MKNKITALLCATVFCVLVLSAAMIGKAQAADRRPLSTEAAFYKGKLIMLIVPYSPGGGYDVYARMVAPYLEKYTGSTVIVQNVPGGGSLVGTMKAYKAKPDGLTVSILELSALISRNILGETLDFDLNKFSWLARVASESELLVAGKKSGYKNIHDLEKSPKPILFCTAGVLSGVFNRIALVAEALRLNVKIITAYEGSSEMDLAVVRGDTDATCGSYSSKLKFLKSGDMVPILQFASVRNKDLPNIPLGTELPNLSANSKALLTFVNHQAIFNRVLAAPPGIPPARLKFLRDAVMRSLTDPELVAIGEAQKKPLDPADATTLTKAITEDLQMSPQLKAQIKKSIYKYVNQ